MCSAKGRHLIFVRDYYYVLQRIDIWYAIGGDVVYAKEINSQKPLLVEGSYRSKLQN